MERREGSWFRAAALWPALCAMALVLAQGQWASRNEAQTWDEGFALVSGLAQVEQGRLDLLVEWPPLMGLLAYVPLQALGPRLPPPPPDQLRDRLMADYAQAFLYGSGNPHRTMLLRARWMALLLMLPAVAALVFWAHRLHGRAGAWLAASLCAFEPSWLAHGHLTAWDGIATSTMALTLAATAWMLDRPSFPRAAALGLALGLALIAKFSALMLLPVLGVLLLASAPPLGRLRLASPLARLPFRRTLLMALVVGVVPLLVIGASYNGTFDLSRYVEGVRSIHALTSEGGKTFENYLLGEFRREPFPHYYLVALAVKLPLGFLALLPLGLVASLRRGPVYLWLPAALGAGIVLVVTWFDPMNLGIRHVVPAIPPLLLLAAGAPRLVAGKPRASWAAAGAFVLAGLGAVEVLWRAPHYLSFFNLIAGGPAHGIEWLDDSSIDWGQDLVALERLQREEGIDQLALHYFGSARPAAYGIRSRPMRPEELTRPRPGTTYAISLHLLNRIGRPRGSPADWLSRHQPWRIAGTSIYLYRFNALDLAR
jgi:hypothetical protein